MAYSFTLLFAEFLVIMRYIKELSKSVKNKDLVVNYSLTINFHQLKNQEVALPFKTH